MADDPGNSSDKIEDEAPPADDAAPPRRHSPLLIWGGIGLAAVLGFVVADRLTPSNRRTSPRSDAPPPRRERAEPLYREPGRETPRTHHARDMIDETSRFASKLGVMLTVANTALSIIRQVSAEMNQSGPDGKTDAPDPSVAEAADDTSVPPGDERVHRL